jgi:tRNA (guanosine-2'-O-)-methyltransferase
MNKNSNKNMMQTELKEYFYGFVSERKRALFERLIQFRTKYLTVVLEDIFQPHNASAVLRTCDCFGIQDVHIIENENPYQINPDVALGASNWLNLYRHQYQNNNTLSTIQHLKQQGYRIVATTPHTNDVSLENFDLHKGKTALFFGTELKGLSQEMLQNADEFLKIPMYGFTESFNISVSASIILHHLTLKLRNSDILWRLSEAQEQEVLLDWLRVAIKNSDSIEKEFYKRFVHI